MRLTTSQEWKEFGPEGNHRSFDITEGIEEISRGGS